jgi:hypothetical protein
MKIKVSEWLALEPVERYLLIVKKANKKAD